MTANYSFISDLLKRYCRPSTHFYLRLMQIFSCCTLNVFNRRGAKICWNYETDFCFSESFLLTAQMWVPPPFQSIIKSFTTTRPYTHSHADPPTQTLIWIHFFWLQPGMTGTSTDTPVETLQAAARRSFYLKSVCFISPLHRISGIHCIQTRSDWIPPNPMPQGATERPNTSRFLGESLPGDTLTLHRDLNKV